MTQQTLPHTGHLGGKLTHNKATVVLLYPQRRTNEQSQRKPKVLTRMPSERHMTSPSDTWWVQMGRLQGSGSSGRAPSRSLHPA